jgi:hypothetical protein
MEDVDCVHEESKWICKFNGCTNSYAIKWLFHQHLDNKHGHHMEASKYGCRCIHVGGLKQQNHQAMNALILNNPQAQQTRNEKKAINRAKEEVKS